MKWGNATRCEFGDLCFLIRLKKIWWDFDRIEKKLFLNFARSSSGHVVANLEGKGGHARATVADRGQHTTAAWQSLFSGPVLGWINADFCVQIRILQHFSRASRKSSRKHIWKKKITKFLRSLQFCLDFLENCRTFAKYCKFLPKESRILNRFLQKSFRIWNMLKNAILDAKNSEDFAKFDKILTRFSA